MSALYIQLHFCPNFTARLRAICCMFIFHQRTVFTRVTCRLPCQTPLQHFIIIIISSSSSSSIIIIIIVIIIIIIIIIIIAFCLILSCVKATIRFQLHI